jgi:hypothetical protein
MEQGFALGMNSQDAERQELERAVELLGRSTRHARLLEYVGAKYFQHQEDQLTEFNIATEVFGRSAQRFIATQDAVVRVEAHRLRKKLREIYEQDTRTHGLQISLPAGTYVPSFSAVPVPPPASAEQAAGGVRGLRRFLKWPVYVSVLAAAAVAVFAFRSIDRSRDATAPTTVPLAADAKSSTATPAGALTELHMMAGHFGSEVIDSSGVRWTPDRYFAAGGTWARDDAALHATSRQFLFSTWRTGEFGYDIPVAPGTYELRLYFVSRQRVGEEKLAGFNVALNGKPLLNAFDVGVSAKGSDIAEEQVFRDITPGKDGFIRLWFTNQSASPFLNALELVPGTPGQLKPIRILPQPTSFVDHKGQRWRADDYFVNGFRTTDRRRVKGTDDPELFSAERFGHFSYSIPVDRRGRYTVILHFVEMYYGPQLPGGGGVGERLFHVFCNGQTLLRDFDIYKEAGSLQVVTKKFSNIQPSAQGKINLDFEPVLNNATVSGIEVLEETD